MGDTSFENFSYVLNMSILERELTQHEKDRVKNIVEDLGMEGIETLTAKVKMFPFVAKLMMSLQIETEKWKQIYDRYQKRNQMIINELAVIYRFFEKHGVKKAFISENFGSMLAADGDIALFASGDIDNYVDISDYAKVSDAFEELGYIKEERYSGNLLISVDFKNDSRLPKGFEIGVEFFPLSRLKLPCFIRADDVVQWDHMRYYRNTRIALPPRSAMMYICLLHISLHSFCRAPAIRLYRDIVNSACDMCENDWNEIIRWAKRDNTKRRVATAAYIATKIAGVEISEEVLKLAEGENCRLIESVYDHEHGILRSEPGKLGVLKIEMCCDDAGVLKGIGAMLFPEKQWMNDVYGNNSIIGYVRHIMRII